MRVGNAEDWEWACRATAAAAPMGAEERGAEVDDLATAAVAPIGAEERVVEVDDPAKAAAGGAAATAGAVTAGAVTAGAAAAGRGRAAHTSWWRRSRCREAGAAGAAEARGEEAPTRRRR